MDNIKKFGILAGLALALVFGGYAAGRYAAPDKVVTVEKLVTIHDVQIVKEVDTEKVLAALQNINKQKDVRKVKTTVKTPDGTVTTTETVDDKTKTETQTKVAEKDTSKTTETKKETEIVVHETIKTVERERPKWRVSVMPGYDIVGALGPYEHYNLLPADSSLLRHAVLGASVERRLIGPLSTGLWGTTQGILGASFSLEF